MTHTSETEQIVEANIQARREQFALGYSQTMAQAVGGMSISMAVLWLFFREHAQLLVFALLVAQLAVCMGVYPVLRRRGRAKAGLYLALFSLTLTATCGFVVFPQTALAALLAQVVTIVIATLTLERKASQALIVILVFLVGVDVVLLHVLGDVFKPLDETAGLLANLCTVTIAFFTTGMMIRTIGLEQEDFFSQSRLAELALTEAYADVERRVEEQTTQLAQETAERERLQQEIIQSQQLAIQELSTPVIPLLEAPGGEGGIIAMPLIGSIDSLRARDIMRALLAGISQHQAQVVILDITGVPVVDSGVASHLNKAIQAAQLKGAQTIVTGISDDVAEAIVDLGIDWSNVTTLGDLQTGLVVALDTLGVKLALAM
jgi:anti-anti-sigma regulatory factor